MVYRQPAKLTHFSRALMHWSRGALECYDVGKDCSHCPTSQVYGIHKNPVKITKQRCYMDQWVDKLLVELGEPTEKAGTPGQKYSRSHSPIREKARLQILAFLDDGQWHKITDVAAFIRKSEQQARLYLNELADEGHLERKNNRPLQFRRLD